MVVKSDPTCDSPCIVDVSGHFHVINDVPDVQPETLGIVAPDVTVDLHKTSIGGGHSTLEDSMLSVMDEATL